MIDPQKVSQLRELIERSQTFCVIYSPSAGLDQLAVASAIYLSLKASERDVKLLSTKAPEKDTPIEGLENTGTEIGNQNLSISFPYNESAVDKVSYHIGEESNRFYLTIKPKKNSQPLSTDEVEFNYTGADFDLIFLVGVGNLESLDQLYFGYEDMFRNAPLVSINSYETTFGLIKFDLSGGASESEAMAQLMFDLNLDLTPDVSTNLLTGISYASQNFSSMSANAQTYEVIAKLMRLGARRIKLSRFSQENLQTKTTQKSKKTKKRRKKEVELKPGGKDHQPNPTSGSHRRS